MRIFERLLTEALTPNPNELLRDVQQLQHLSQQVLGEVDTYPILLLTPKERKPRPNILIAAGFHGDEPAGPYGLLQFLQRHNVNINVSFLPLVNPTGLEKHHRNNRHGQNPNRGFDDTRPLSKEGEVLMLHADMLKMLSVDGFLSLHEDRDKKTFHLYTYERAERPGSFTETLRHRGVQWCEGASTKGELDWQEAGALHGETEAEAIPETGLVFNEQDSSFESYLFRSGSAVAACTETGGKLDFNRRVEANADLAKTFIEYIYSASR